jgi:hypothetical protein
MHQVRGMSPRGGVVLLAMSATIAALAAATLAMPASDADDNPNAVNAVLTKLASADSTPYRARQLVVYFGRPQSAAVLDVQSTHDGEFVRAESGSNVTKVWREAGMGIVSSAGTNLEEASDEIVPLDPKRVVEKYEIDVGPPQELLGVRVVPLTLVRREDRRLVERWLVHPQSGIVYQRGLYGADDKLVAMSTIIDMRWGDSGLAERFDPGTGAPARVRRIKPTGVPRRLAEGYRLLHAYRLRAGGRTAQQFVYSDGLHALSVFRTNGHLRGPSGFDPSRFGSTQGWTGPGPGTWAWEGSGHGYVMVAEEPALDPAEMIHPFPQGGPSVLSRMGSVWSSIFHGVARLV